MIKFFNGIAETVLLRVFIWTGTKLWGHITVYQPDDSGEIRAIHFGDSAESILESAKEMVDGSVE